MELYVKCECGWRAQDTEDSLVDAVQQHGVDTHDIALTRDQILVIARPVVTDQKD